MSKLEVIESILNVTFKDESCKLTETEIDKHGKPFTMTRHIVADRELKYALFKFDAKKDIFPFFNSANGVKKMCDYILFVEEGAHLYALLIELKKGTESALKQLNAAECFVDFLLNTAARLNSDLELSEETYHVRKIRISESISSKTSLSREVVMRENGVLECNHEHCFFVRHYL